MRVLDWEGCHGMTMDQDFLKNPAKNHQSCWVSIQYSASTTPVPTQVHKYCVLYSSRISIP